MEETVNRCRSARSRVLPRVEQTLTRSDAGAVDRQVTDAVCRLFDGRGSGLLGPGSVVERKRRPGSIVVLTRRFGATDCELRSLLV
jgi:hypothetical protein